METTIGARIRQLREAKRLSVAEFAEAAGIRPSAVYGLEGGANKPSLKTVAALQASFPDLNTAWLQFGQGSMFKAGELTPLSQLPPNLPQPVPDQFEEQEEGGRQIMLLSYSEEKMLAGMTDAQRADYWRARYETDIEQANRREKDLLDRLTSRKLKASADAAAPGPMFESSVDAPARTIVQGFGGARVYNLATGQLDMAA